MELSLRLIVLATVLLTFVVFSSEAVKCFQCNSFYNETCNDPFDKKDETLMKEYLKDCPAAHTYCRKIDQAVNGETRTIRQCGKDESPMECRDKVGSKGIRAGYCTCTDDKCNGSTRLINIGLGLQIVAASLLSYLVSSYIKL